MEPLYIPTTEDTPEVRLEPENNVFEISNRSLPENAMAFYKPILDWLEEYIASPNENTLFDFKLEYFNTASAKQVAKVLLVLEKLSKNSKVTARWHYESDDTDMLSSGKRYEKLIDLNFEFVEVPAKEKSS